METSLAPHPAQQARDAGVSAAGLTVADDAVAIAIATALALPVATVHAAPNAAITAQGMAGTVIGVVKEAARGEYLDGARVTLDGRQVASQRDGSFRLGGIAPGRYTLHVDYLGYQPQQVEIEVDGNQGLHVDVTLVSTTALRPMM